jgi:hypothetical protein
MCQHKGGKFEILSNLHKNNKVSSLHFPHWGSLLTKSYDLCYQKISTLNLDEAKMNYT